jgi:hypothetical protein
MTQSYEQNNELSVSIRSGGFLEQLLKGLCKLTQQKMLTVFGRYSN